MNGKGSRRRPSFISDAQLADNWAAAFGNKPKQHDERIVAHVEVPVDRDGNLLIDRLQFSGVDVSGE